MEMRRHLHSAPFFLGRHLFPSSHLHPRSLLITGCYTQFDLLNQFAGVPGSLPGHATSAYGQDYATHVMLLTDDLSSAGRAISFLANTTSVGGQTLSPLYFYERMEYPWLKGMAQVRAFGVSTVNVGSGVVWGGM
jgi:hypothetical protein